MRLVATPCALGQDAKTELPKEKQTTLGLYVTAAQAYEKWKAAPDTVKVIDVRTPEEYAFVGHAEMAWNIPVAFVTYQRKDGKTEYGARPNPDFVAEIKKLAARPIPSAPVPVRWSLRDGRQPARSRGFKNVYNVTDGFEGDKVDDPESVFFGKRMRNGWKNSAPWTYGIDPERSSLKRASQNKQLASAPTSKAQASQLTPSPTPPLLPSYSAANRGLPVASVENQQRIDAERLPWGLGIHEYADRFLRESELLRLVDICIEVDDGGTRSTV